MKAALEFNLPKEATEHTMAVHSVAYHCIISELGEKLRRMEKDGETTTIEAIRAMLWEIVESHGVSDDFS